MTNSQARALVERRAQEWHKRYYSQLNGATLAFVCMTEDEWGNPDFPTFLAKLPDGRTIQLEVSRDPEGNGGGFIFGMDFPDMADFDKESGFDKL
jgi:hypothetical protein